MIKKILVAIDGSAHSLKAVNYASEIAGAVNANLIILNVVKSQDLPKGLRAYAELEHITGLNIDILTKVGNALVTNAEKSARDGGVKDITNEVKEGPFARTIVARAKHHAVDMIVIGSRGMGNVEATLRGGVAHRVGILAECPVLTVK